MTSHYLKHFEISKISLIYSIQIRNEIESVFLMEFFEVKNYIFYAFGRS